MGISLIAVGAVVLAAVAFLLFGRGGDKGC
jgi:hypothetical protein